MRTPALFRNFIVFAFILALCVGGLGYHIVRSSADIRSIDQRVNHTQTVIMNMQDLITIVINTISQQRNYVISGEEPYLKAYEETKAQLSSKIAYLRDLTIDNPSQATRLNEIEHLSLKLKDVLDQKITSFQGTPLIPTLADYNDMVKIRDNMLRLSYDVLKAEYKLLGVRERKVTNMIDQYQLSLLAGGIVASLIILIFNWYLLQAKTQASLAEASLRESEERLRLAIRGSNDGIFDWNFKTHQIYWSSQYKAMLGYSDDEIKGDEETFRTLLYPEDSESFWESFNNYINGSLSEFSCVFRMVHKSGRAIWVHGRGKAIFDENGQPQRFIGAHTDISYIKEHERQLKEERDRAEDQQDVGRQEANLLPAGPFRRGLSHSAPTSSAPRTGTRS